MKKLFTLLAATFCATAIFAQYDDHGYDQRRNEQTYQTQDFRNGRDHNDNYRFDGRNNRKIQRQVDRINREFDYKIDRVRSSWMRSFDKQRAIFNLEQQRREEIRQVYARFGGRDNNWDRRGF